MVKHTQTVRRLLPTICLCVFDHFVGLVLKGLSAARRVKSKNFLAPKSFKLSYGKIWKILGVYSEVYQTTNMEVFTK